jgi:hypothetical protein
MDSSTLVSYISSLTIAIRTREATEGQTDRTELSFHSLQGTVTEALDHKQSELIGWLCLSAMHFMQNLMGKVACRSEPSSAHCSLSITPQLQLASQLAKLVSNQNSHTGHSSWLRWQQTGSQQLQRRST